MEKQEQIQVRKGRPIKQHVGHTFIRVPLEVHAKLKRIAENEQRTIQVVIDRIITKGFLADESTRLN